MIVLFLESIVILIRSLKTGVRRREILSTKSKIGFDCTIIVK